MTDQWTTRGILAWIAQDLESRGVDSPRLDAELVVASALGTKRISLYLDLDRPLDGEERGRIREALARRRQREPMAYIVGEREFYGRSFEVNDAVLVPRPETETLVELALSFLKSRDNGGAKDIPRAIDLGTGSGCIAISIAAEHPDAHVLAVDISESALSVARRNAERHDVAERVRFVCADMRNPPETRVKYDLIVSNPPYIATNAIKDLMPEVAVFEPKHALDGGPDGLDFYRALSCYARDTLTPGGALFVEVGDTQADAVMKLFSGSSHQSLSTRSHADLGGRARVVELSAQESPDAD